MKRTLVAGAVVSSAAFALFSASAGAAEVCRNAADNTYMTMDSAGATCHDWGTGDGWKDIEWETSPGGGNDTLDLPVLEQDYNEFKIDSVEDEDGNQDPTGTLGMLSVVTWSGPVEDPDGIYTYSGTFSILSGVLNKAAYIVFKLGGGNSVPSWIAYELAAGQAYTDVAITLVGNRNLDDSNGVPNNLSHTSLYVSDSDDLTQVPLPAAAWLLGSGLLGLFAVGRRRKAGQVSAA